MDKGKRHGVILGQEAYILFGLLEKTFVVNVLYFFMYLV